ncbi:hypothetical protein VI03_24785 [Burkholderia vietnamiensis]|uniref:hypothetical protein n=1 Tax=Burkholderia vietnamiensis TaxID=60552 RepID=UPI0006219BB4|nr:hypothetical protein [Burkholderia vietnamiensis]KKI36003.1 hypothetical protein VI03_24785 [Burkholderia vietnamiensis]MBR8189251.1 hypothetical protein [Burkholderia vietnamiensis]
MRVLGFEEAITTCDCCGKAKLKGTFAVERDDGEILYYGSVCVTRHTGKAAKAVRQEARDATEARRQLASKELADHPATIADRLKMQEGHKRGLRPPEFIEFHREELAAAEQARREIAAKYGFKPYQLY